LENLEIIPHYVNSLEELYSPVEKIKKIIVNVSTEIKINSVLDFGSGTFFWSVWFLSAFTCQIYAVDKCYKEKIISKDRVKCYSELDECFIDCQVISVVFACDVLHHLDTVEYETFFERTINKSKVIIIKDIDKNHPFGNFMNKMHDKIINKENANIIDPKKVERSLIQNGYKTQYYYIPKLWYPHFIVMGIKLFL
jgi:hypothetical protein